MRAVLSGPVPLWVDDVAGAVGVAGAVAGAAVAASVMTSSWSPGVASRVSSGGNSAGFFRCLFALYSLISLSRFLAALGGVGEFDGADADAGSRAGVTGGPPRDDPCQRPFSS